MNRATRKIWIQMDSNGCAMIKWSQVCAWKLTFTATEGEKRRRTAVRCHYFRRNVQQSLLRRVVYICRYTFNFVKIMSLCAVAYTLTGVATMHSQNSDSFSKMPTLYFVEMCRFSLSFDTATSDTHLCVGVCVSVCLSLSVYRVSVSLLFNSNSLKEQCFTKLLTIFINISFTS